MALFPYFLAIPLPFSIRSQLARLCYGLPYVQWTAEENLHLTLRYLGPLSSLEIQDVQECLSALFFHPFLMKLEGIGHFNSKNRHGVIWAGVKETLALSSLKKQIDLLFRNLSVPSERHSFHPHVTLGRYEQVPSHKLHDYLLSHVDYQSEEVSIHCCQLLQSRQTAKHVLYEKIDEYLATDVEFDF